MENKQIMVESLFDNFKEYIYSGYQLQKLRTIERASDIFSTLIVRLCILAVFSVFFLFLNIGIALWLGEILGKVYYGFFIVSLFYFIQLLYVLLTRKNMKGKLNDFIITKSLNN